MTIQYILRFLYLGTLSFLYIALIGCAGISGGQLDLSDKKAGDTLPGIPYYESSTFLMVIPEPTGGYTTEFVELPDPSRLRYIDPWTFLSKHDYTLTFKDGVLVSSNSNIDATKVPIALIDAAVSAAKSSIAQAAVLADSDESTERSYTSPYLFKVVMKDNKTELIGTGGYTVAMPQNVVTRPASRPKTPPVATATDTNAQSKPKTTEETNK